MDSPHDTDPGGNTDTKAGNEPYARKGNTNPAADAPKRMRNSDKGYIDNKLKTTFIKGHAMNVHRNHMDIVNSARQANRRKIP